MSVSSISQNLPATFYANERTVKSVNPEPALGIKTINGLSEDVFYSSIDSRIEEAAKQNPQMKEFAESLIENRDKIKKEINITDEEYDLFSNFAVGLAKFETDYGSSSSYEFKKNHPNISKFLHAFKRNGSLSQGITNIKYEDLGNSEKAVLKKLGVTDLNDPKQSAIATIVHLNVLKNAYYDKYMKEIAPSQDTPLTMEEYVLTRWKGSRVNTEASDKKVRKKATENMRNILEGRQHPAKEFAWKVLNYLNYGYLPETNEIIDIAE